MKRTITIDTGLVAVVPVDPLAIMAGGFAYADAAGLPFSHPGYEALIAAVPAALPGVVEHSGEPVGYTAEQESQKWPYPIYPTASAYIDVPLFTHPPAQPDTAALWPVLKGIGKINGDGWKDKTCIGEVVFVWNTEKPAPYAKGNYPRIGNYCGWTASTDQYDFSPATVDEIMDLTNTAALQAQIAELEAQRDNLIQQAQIQAQEARSHRATVIDTLNALDLPYRNWEATSLIVGKVSKLEAQLAAQAGHEIEAEPCADDGGKCGAGGYCDTCPHITPITQPLIAETARDDVITYTAPTGWDAEFLSKRLGRVANIVGIPMPDMTHEQIAECAGTILGQIASKLDAAVKRDDVAVDASATLQEVTKLVDDWEGYAISACGDERNGDLCGFIAKLRAAIAASNQNGGAE